jgi:hypothetical protein
MSQRNSLKPSCGCNIERALHHDENYIFITGAQKQSDSPSGKSYVAYHIRIGVSIVVRLLFSISVAMILILKIGY